MKYIFVVLAIFINGCVYQPVMEDRFDSKNGDVKIFSTSNVMMAQAKADVICGHRAFYLKSLHESNINIARKSAFDNSLFNYIPFQCDVHSAAKAGNTEAKIIVDKELQESYKRLEDAKRNQYEIHKSYAKKHGGDSYTIVNPDGSIEAISFDSKGNECRSTANQYGAQTYCN